MTVFVAGITVEAVDKGVNGCMVKTITNGAIAQDGRIQVTIILKDPYSRPPCCAHTARCEWRINRTFKHDSFLSQVGDYIITVNNETLKLITNAQARAILRRASLLGIDIK